MKLRVSFVALLVACALSTSTSAQSRRRFVLVTPGPPVVTNTAPTDGATGVSINPTLACSATTATDYALYLGTDNPPTNLLNFFGVGEGAPCSYAPSTLTNSTTYYYKWLASGPGGASYGPIWSFTTLAASGVIYYVSDTTGSDARSCATAQTITTPKKTLRSAVPCLSASGDETVYVRAGTYTGSGNAIDAQSHTFNSGLVGHPNTISGYPGETVTIQPPNDSFGIRFNNTDYIVLQDLTFDGINTMHCCGEGGAETLVFLYNDSDHNLLQRLTVKNNSYNGVGFSSGSSSNTLRASYIYNNGRLDTEANSGYGIYVSTSNNIVEGNEFEANNGYAVHVNAEGDADGGVNNVVYGNNIHGNFVHGPAGTGGTTMYGIATRATNGTLIYNNLIWNNQGGIFALTYSTGTGIYNNTIYNNDGHGGGGECAIQMQYYDGPPTIRNNIIYDNAQGTICDDGGTGTYTADHNLTTNPSFVNAGAANFHLQVGSAARNAGQTVGSVTTDLSGVARDGTPDIGAYEYVP